MLLKEKISLLTTTDTNHSFITEKFRNNPQCTIILGGDFNAGDIDWESHTVCEHKPCLFRETGKLMKKFFL